MLAAVVAVVLEPDGLSLAPLLLPLLPQPAARRAAAPTSSPVRTSDLSPERGV